MVVALAGGGAAADPAAADRAAAEADALARAGRFAEAAVQFRAAWIADRQRPELFCNIGISYYKARDLVRAHLLLGQCLEQAALDPKFVAAARGALASVEGVLRGGGHAPVRFVVEPAGSSVAIDELGADGGFVGSRVVWLPLGSYHVAAHAEGYADAAEVVTASSTAPVTVTLTLRRPVAAPDGRPDGAHDTRPGASIERDAAPPVPMSVPQPRLPLLPVMATGGTVLALVVTFGAFRAAHLRADLAASALDTEILAADQQVVSRWNTVMGVAGAAAVVGGAASAYLWYRWQHHGASIDVFPQPGGAALSLSGRF
jgi:hypothetical protein